MRFQFDFDITTSVPIDVCLTWCYVGMYFGRGSHHLLYFNRFVVYVNNIVSCKLHEVLRRKNNWYQLIDSASSHRKDFFNLFFQVRQKSHTWFCLNTENITAEQKTRNNNNIVVMQF